MKSIILTILSKSIKITFLFTLLFIGITNSYSQKKVSKDKTFTLIVEREKNKIIGTMVDINIFFNEKKICSIKNGTTKTFILKSTKSGFAVLRAEPSNLIGNLIVGKALGKDDIETSVRKELKIKTTANSTYKVFCTFDEIGLYFREIEL